MKVLQYDFGFLNLSSIEWFEITLKEKDPNLFEVFFDTPGKEILIFSCEDKDQADSFRFRFFDCVRSFLKKDSLEYEYISEIVHSVISSL